MKLLGHLITVLLFLPFALVYANQDLISLFPLQRELMLNH